MALDPQTQAKIDLLLAQARMVYESILEAQPVTELARSVRDKKTFEKLSDAEIESVCHVVKNLEKRMAAAEKLAAEATAPAAPSSPAAPPAPTELPAKPAAPNAAPAPSRRRSGRAPAPAAGVASPSDGAAAGTVGDKT